MPSGISSFFSGQTGARGSIPSSGIENYIKLSTTGRSASPYSALSELMKMRALMTYMQDPTGSGLRPSSIDGFRLSGGTKLTAKERQALLDQAHMQQAQNAIYNNEDFRNDYQRAMQLSAQKAQDTANNMVQAYIKPTAAQFGVDANQLTDIMMGRLRAETKQRVKDVAAAKADYGVESFTSGLKHFFSDTLPYVFRSREENEAASREYLKEQEDLRQRNAYARDQALREAEGEGFFERGSGSTGSWLANMGRMAGESAPMVAATIATGGLAGAGAGALGLGVQAANAARIAGTLGMGALTGGEAAHQAFGEQVMSDTSLSPEQQRAALDSPERLGVTAIGAALGGLPLAGRDIYRAVAPRIGATSAGREVQRLTGEIAARNAIPREISEQVGDVIRTQTVREVTPEITAAARQQALEQVAAQQAYQDLAPGFLSRVVNRAKWTLPETEAIFAAQGAASNALYGSATGQDIPLTTGMEESLAEGIPFALFGAIGGAMGGRGRTNFLRAMRSDGTRKVTPAELANTINEKIQAGTLGDAVTLDAIKSFRSDWTSRSAFDEALAQVDPQYRNMLGAVYDVLGKKNVKQQDIAKAFATPLTPETPAAPADNAVYRYAQPELVGPPSDLYYARERQRQANQQYQQYNNVNASIDTLDDSAILRIGNSINAEAGYTVFDPANITEARRVLHQLVDNHYAAELMYGPGGGDRAASIAFRNLNAEMANQAAATATPARPSAPATPAARPSAPATPAAQPSAPASPAAQPSAPATPAAQPSAPATPAAQPSSPATPAAQPSSPATPAAQPSVPTTPPARPGKSKGKIMEAAQQAVDTVLPKPAPLPDNRQSAFVSFNTEQSSPTVRRIADYVRTKNKLISADQILDAFISDMQAQKASTKQIKAHYDVIKSLLEDITGNKGPKGSVASVSISPDVADFWTSIKSTLNLFRGDVTLKSLQKFRESLNVPETLAEQSGNQRVGNNVPAGEAAADTNTPGVPRSVEAPAPRAPEQAPQPAAPADTAAGRADEGGRPGGAEAQNVGQGEVAVPPTEQAGAQPVADGTNGGRGAEPTAEGTPAAGESTGVTPAAGSRGENIQQPSQNAGNREAVRQQRGEAIQRFVEGLPDEKLKELALKVHEGIHGTLNKADTKKLVERMNDKGMLASLRDYFTKAAYSTAKKGDDAVARRIIRGAMRESTAETNKKVPTADESIVAGEQVRREAETDPDVVPPTNQVDEPAAPVAEAPKAPEVKIRRKGGKDPSAPTLGDGPFITKDELPDVARYIQKLPLNKLKQLARALDELDGQKGTETTSYTYTINKKSGGDKEARKMLIEEAANADPRVSGVKEVHGIIKDFINGKISYPEEQPAPAAPKNEQKTVTPVNKGTPENNMSALINKNQEQQAEAPTPEGSPRIIKIRDAYNALSVLRSERGLAGNRLNSELEKDLDLLFDAAIKGTDSFSKVQKDRYEEITKALGGLRIDTQDMQAAIAYQESAAKDGMTVSNGQALAHIAGESNTTNNALNNKPQHVC